MFLNYSVGEDSWEFLGQQKIKPVNPKGNQPWIFIGMTGTEAEAPILWSFDARSWLIRKDPEFLKGFRNSTNLIFLDNQYLRDWSVTFKAQVALVVKNPPANTGDVRDGGPIPGSGRSPREGHGNPLQYSFLENPMDRVAWQVTVHGVAKSWIRLKQLGTAHKHLAWRAGRELS